MRDTAVPLPTSFYFIYPDYEDKFYYMDHRYLSTNLHGVISKKTATLTVTAVTTSEIISLLCQYRSRNCVKVTVQLLL